MCIRDSLYSLHIEMHSLMVQDECVCPGTMNMESMLLLGAGLLTAAFVAVVVFAPSTLTDESADWEIVDVCLAGHSEIVSHDHATLSIFIDGSEVSIAANIGIDDSECDGMRGIHTHDETGKLHIAVSYTHLTLPTILLV